MTIYEYFSERLMTRYIEQNLAHSDLDETGYLNEMGENGFELVSTEKVGDGRYGASERKYYWRREKTGATFESIANKHWHRTSDGIGYNVIP